MATITSSNSSSLKRSNAKISMVLSKSSQPLFSSPILLSSSTSSTPASSLATAKSILAMKYKKEVFITSKPKSKCDVKSAAVEDNVVKTAAKKSDMTLISPKEPAHHVAKSSTEEPFVEILEQPIILKNSNNEIVGEGTTQDVKSFPCIRIQNCPSSSISTAGSVVVVSCVAATSPFRSHPNKLLWRDGQSERGVVSATFDSSEVFRLQSLMLEQSKKTTIKQAMEERQAIRVDPFRQGFNFEDDEFDLTSVRLCFQVFLKYHDGALQPLKPVVSNTLRLEKKRKLVSQQQQQQQSFQITEISQQSFPAVPSGNMRVVLGCSTDISQSEFEIRLEQKDEQSGVRVWGHAVRSAEISSNGNNCFSFVVPPYKDPLIKKPVPIKLYLYRVADKRYSKSILLHYTPMMTEQHQTGLHSQTSKLLEIQQRQQQILPKVGTSYSIVTMPADKASHRNQEEDDDDVVVLPDSIERPEADEDPRLQLLRNSLTTLTKALNAEREANKYLSQRSVSLQQHQDELRQLKVSIQLELEAAKSENEQLKSGNAALGEKLLDLEQEVAEWRRGASEERIIRHLQEEGRELRLRNERLQETVRGLNVSLAEQRRGVGNMRWQLAQKESQVRALEAKLEETFPVPVESPEMGSSCVTSSEVPPACKRRREVSPSYSD